MIQANELRIGNTITHHNNNGIYLVTALETLKNGVNVKTNLQLGEWFLRCEEVQGTPLTEEWLLIFGFELTYESDYRRKFDMSDARFGYDFDLNGNANGMQGFRYIGNYLGHFKHVHQLQNLYFALTGKELI